MDGPGPPNALREAMGSNEEKGKLEKLSYSAPCCQDKSSSNSVNRSEKRNICEKWMEDQ
jgi:hypothetical protein